MKKFTKEITALLATVAVGISANAAASTAEEITPIKGGAIAETGTTITTTNTIPPYIGTQTGTTTTTTTTIPPYIGTQTGTTTATTTTIPPLIGTQTAATTTAVTTTDIEIPPRVGEVASCNGDVNGDGLLNIADAVTLQKHLLNKTKYPLAYTSSADVCTDGEINVFDLVAIKRIILEHNVFPGHWVKYGALLEIIGDNPNMYAGPGTNYPVVSVRMSNARERGYSDEYPDWVYAEFNGTLGWIKLKCNNSNDDNVRFYMAADKPVIYLYPEQETDVHVELDLKNADLATTYPKYNGGWDVTASPDGTLVNKSDGTHHNYLFWDADDVRIKYDFSKGFCVAGSDTEKFLKEKLTYMGLTEKEMNEFIVYWLPLMEHNAYNLIAFQDSAYTDSAKLNITPSPDSICRIFMAYKPLDSQVEIEPQQLSTFERKGFTVVEWGGSEIK